MYLGQPTSGGNIDSNVGSSASSSATSLWTFLSPYSAININNNNSNVLLPSIFFYLFSYFRALAPFGCLLWTITTSLSYLGNLEEQVDEEDIVGESQEDVVVLGLSDSYRSNCNSSRISSEQQQMVKVKASATTMAALDEEEGYYYNRIRRRRRSQLLS